MTLLGNVIKKTIEIGGKIPKRKPQTLTINQVEDGMEYAILLTFLLVGSNIFIRVKKL